MGGTSETKEIRNLIDKCNALEIEKDESEDRLDKMETSTQYLKKILGNFHELKNMSMKIKESYNNLNNEIMNKLKETNSKLILISNGFVKYSFLNFVGLLMFIIIGNLSINDVIIMIVINFTSTLFTFTIINTTPNKIVNLIKNTKKYINDMPGRMIKLKDLEREMIKTEESHGFINEYIDNI